MVRDWQGGGRARVQKEIEDLARLGDSGGARLAERKDYIASMDSLVNKMESMKNEDKGRLRSRLNTVSQYRLGRWLRKNDLTHNSPILVHHQMAKWMAPRRQQTKYKGPEYEVMDYLYCCIPLVQHKRDDGRLEMYWPEIGSVYSEEVSRSVGLTANAPAYRFHLRSSSRRLRRSTTKSCRAAANPLGRKSSSPMTITPLSLPNRTGPVGRKSCIWDLRGGCSTPIGWPLTRTTRKCK